MQLREAQKVQHQFDEQHWAINDDSFAKTLHIALHLMTLFGKLGRYCERTHHQANTAAQPITEEVIPDLLIYALQLANLFNVNLEAAYAARLERNRRLNEHEVAGGRINGSRTLGRDLPSRVERRPPRTASRQRRKKPVDR